MDDKLTFYRSGLLKKQWRWRYQAGGNSEKLANGGESYHRLEDAMKAAFRVVGLDNPYETEATSTVVGEADRVLTRGNGFDVEVRFR
jgi:hypothetical protein